MRFYSTSECEAWLQGRQRELPTARGGLASYRLCYSGDNAQQMYYLARWITSQLTFRMPSLFWIRETAIWGPVNWHLYYRLRQSYADMRLLDEAPGHLFLEHENEDLATFLQFAILNGWDAYLLTQADYVNLFFSHDEFIEFYSRNESTLLEVREAFPDGVLRCDPQSPAL
jgi:hypothetical protein